MPEYVRVAEFEGDSSAVDDLVAEINAASGPPEGVPATSIVILADRAAGKMRTAVFFDSEENLRTGAATLDAMSPPGDVKMQRTSVTEWEVVLQRSL